jgi:hypothetical protein
MDWVKGLREIALEGAGGSRANADKLSAAQSGRAMELMNQALIWLADKLRISYGEGALLGAAEHGGARLGQVRLVDKKGASWGSCRKRRISPCAGQNGISQRMRTSRPRLKR